MDRGLGFIASFKVLPKTEFSLYADHTTRAMNRNLLSALGRIWH